MIRHLLALTICLAAIPARAEVKKSSAAALRTDYAKAVEAFIERNTDPNSEAYLVWDADEGLDRELRLERIHVDKIVSLGGGRVFACADFVQAAAEGDTRKVKVDLDFYAKRTKTGYVIEDVLIHKVQGRPRFTYDDKNQRVEVPPSEDEPEETSGAEAPQQVQPPAPAPARPKGREHPEHPR